MSSTAAVHPPRAQRAATVRPSSGGLAPAHRCSGDVRFDIGSYVLDVASSVRFEASNAVPIAVADDAAFTHNRSAPARFGRAAQVVDGVEQLEPLLQG